MEEKRLVSTAYYLLSDHKVKLYRDIDHDPNSPEKFLQRVYTLRQMSTLFPKMFSFFNVN